MELQLLPFHLIFTTTKLLILILLIFLTSSYLQPVTSRKHNNFTDLESLLAFRADADPHGILAANWTTNTSFCNWVGVYCSRRRQRVTDIRLENLPLQEYATTWTVSRMGDVYSFGILLLETFTGRRPVDSIFGEQSSLREWICKAHSNTIIDAVDKNIQKYHDTDNDVQKLLRCLSSVIELGLLCSNYSPKERIPMTDVATRLQKIKLEYLSS